MRLYHTGIDSFGGCGTVPHTQWEPLWSVWEIYAELIHVGGAIG